MATSETQRARSKEFISAFWNPSTIGTQSFGIVQCLERLWAICVGFHVSSNCKDMGKKRILLCACGIVFPNTRKFRILLNLFANYTLDLQSRRKGIFEIHWTIVEWIGSWRNLLINLQVALWIRTENRGASPTMEAYMITSLVQTCRRLNVRHGCVLHGLVLEGRGPRGGWCSCSKFSLSLTSSILAMGEGLDMHLERLL